MSNYGSSMVKYSLISLSTISFPNDRVVFCPFEGGRNTVRVILKIWPIGTSAQVTRCFDRRRPWDWTSQPFIARSAGSWAVHVDSPLKCSCSLLKIPFLLDSNLSLVCQHSFPMVSQKLVTQHSSLWNPHFLLVRAPSNFIKLVKMDEMSQVFRINHHLRFMTRHKVMRNPRFSPFFMAVFPLFQPLFCRVPGTARRPPRSSGTRHRSWSSACSDRRRMPRRKARNPCRSWDGMGNLTGTLGMMVIYDIWYIQLYYNVILMIIIIILYYKCRSYMIYDNDGMGLYIYMITLW